MTGLVLRSLSPSVAILPVAATVILWASAFPGIRAALEGFSPLGLASLRFSLAALILLAFAWIGGGTRPLRSDIPRILMSGAAGIAAYNIALNQGELTVSAGAASFIVSIAPIFTALLSTLFLGERVGWWGWIGMIVSLAGVGIIAQAEAGAVSLGWGAGLVLLAAFLQALYFVLMKPLIARYGPLQATRFAVWSGAAMLLPWLAPGVKEAAQAPAGALFAALYLAAFPAALAYLVWSFALAKLPASRAAAWLYLVPPAATAIAIAWPGEMPATASLLGGVVCLSGVLLVQLRGRIEQAGPLAPLPSAPEQSVLEGGHDGHHRHPKTGRILPPPNRGGLCHG
ncbi:MAG TPA: DMT family transporter [Alphaproteobacteria bacterium]|nr:DMT family transporter [Alphaproteobacteria bacterium]